uniref:Uncharacterized protein n=1 Tax=viral metagenome TaxID=1070528 RepID=A0A6M3KVK3_9ZZZZ
MEFQKMKYDIMRCRWTGGKDLDVADTSCTYPLHDLAQTNYLIEIRGRVITAFAGITGPVTIKVGVPTVPDIFLKAQNLATVYPFITHNIVDSEDWCAGRSNALWNMSDAIVTFTSDSGNLEDLTAGEVELIIVRLIPDPDA